MSPKPPTSANAVAAPPLATPVASLTDPRFPRLRLLLRSPLPLTAACILLVLVLLAVFAAPYIATLANRQNLSTRFFAPFQTDQGFFYVLGADALGRSMLAQLIYGARTSFMVACSAVAIATAIGMTVGLISGYFGGWLDAILMRISDIIVTLPSLLMALAILFVLGPSMINLIAVLAVARLPVFLRTARAQTLATREWTFIEAARATGSPPFRIIGRDIRPMVAPTILTVAMLELGNTILAVAGLSFLGVGLQRPDIDWGTLVSEGRQYMEKAWWVTVFPGIAVMVTALSSNVLSNWLRAVADPQQATLLYAAASRRSKAK